MSDDNRVPARVPECKTHPEGDIRRKKTTGFDIAVCTEGPHGLGYYCMSDMNGSYCKYLRHTTATHETLSGQTWVDVDMEKADVQVALGDEEVQLDFD